MNIQALNDHFAQIVQASVREPIAHTSSCDNSDSFAFQAASVNQVERLLKAVKTSTATGPDEIPGFLVKKLATAIAPALTDILNTSFDSKCFPALWKKANVCPVWKGKGCRTDPTNYRPISIISVLARVCEKIAAGQLYEYCDRMSVIPPEQFGFRRQSSCEMTLLSAFNG